MSAYWIAHVTIHDMEQYKQYIATAPQAFQKYGAKFLARGGASEVLEGKAFERHVVIEFPDMETARECYFSPEYQLAKSKREGCCDVMVSFVEGI
ncbi:MULTISPECIES: DUF1330 domain-containing protein [Acinetobacter]|jgi:uncharacterized protein (DUF1330 family)|uniref:DUF1330 domain-containing protein n=1 Tax=Acinetobacter calcoaceticus TaxID=471 RepID=A0A446ZL32_ACICA|nr:MULTISPECIES: DUF1330 domain-containing protein [Acinetobacter]MCU4422805.1 DUF1330 domain-containing protein [Acinetobacter sp. WU_MDCI_Abxb74]CAI3144179.1 hypothetical protein MWMV8_MWMV8_01500 [Acinetobacter calcoaceticus]VAX45101.1 Uncharacterised protein [Acinetobacter calcoaceticus]